MIKVILAGKTCLLKLPCGFLFFIARINEISHHPSRCILEDSQALFKFLIFSSFVPSCIRKDELFQFEKELNLLAIATAAISCVFCFVW